MRINSVMARSIIDAIMESFRYLARPTDNNKKLILKELFTAGFDIYKTKDFRGDTLLSLAAKKNNTPLEQFLNGPGAGDQNG